MKTMATILEPRNAAVLLVLALAIAGVAAFIGTASMRDDALARLSAAQRQHARLRSELEALQQLQPALDAALGHWNTLAALGAMQPPSPGIWAAQASRGLERQGVASKELHFAPPRPAAGGTDPNGPRILLHGLDIDAPLQHEGRLPALIAALATTPGAVVLPRSCTLTRLDAATAGQVHARCRLDWLTISLPSGANAR
ncbi:hypothetical protein [Thauera sp.]|uniref:hypothetical protein n=1 Tax=Thauera sp. TaxID=1905334 RepID=UPI0039E61FC6